MAESLESLFAFLQKEPQNMRVKIKRVFSTGMVEKLRSELQAHSPRDTGNYANAWEVDRARYTDNSVIAGLRIVNRTPYAFAMEYGGQLGGSPWPWYPRVKTGKLTDVDGRVWAGGESPGHSNTVGGAIKQVREKNKDFRELTNEIAGSIVKGWQ